MAAKQKKPALSREVQKTILEYVRQKVRAGYDSLADCRRSLRDTDPEDLFDEGTIDQAALRKEIDRVLQLEATALARDAKKWPKTTDNDRLDAAFEELEQSYAILARQDYWCCQTCGRAAIQDELQPPKKRSKKKHALPIGFVFFHNQDTESAVNNGGLFLAYGSTGESDPVTRAVGRVVVDVLRDHGLKPRWDNDTETRIYVPIKWRRRIPRVSVDRP